MVETVVLERGWVTFSANWVAIGSKILNTEGRIRPIVSNGGGATESERSGDPNVRGKCQEYVGLYLKS